MLLKYDPPPERWLLVFGYRRALPVCMTRHHIRSIAATALSRHPRGSVRLQLDYPNQVIIAMCVAAASDAICD